MMGAHGGLRYTPSQWCTDTFGPISQRAHKQWHWQTLLVFNFSFNDWFPRPHLYHTPHKTALRFPWLPALTRPIDKALRFLVEVTSQAL
jgi:hypothetical protein